MKTYISPEFEIRKFDVEDIITTSSGTGTLNTVLKVVGVNAGEVSYEQLVEDLSGEPADIFK